MGWCAWVRLVASKSVLLLLLFAQHGAAHLSPSAADIALHNKTFGALHTDPLSMMYFKIGGEPAATVLPRWQKSQHCGSTAGPWAQPGERTCTTVWTEPSGPMLGGPQLRVVFNVTSFSDAPSATWWGLEFENLGDSPSAIISDVRPAALSVNSRGNSVLHWIRGSSASPNDFQPMSTVLSLNKTSTLPPELFEQPPGWVCCSGMSSDGSIGKDGKISGGAAPFFRLETGNGDEHVFAVGWTGAWQVNLTESSESASAAAKIKIEAGFVSGPLRGVVHDVGFHARALPGERFRVPSMLVLSAAGGEEGQGFRGTNLWRRMMLVHFSGGLSPTKSAPVAVAPGVVSPPDIGTPLPHGIYDDAAARFQSESLRRRNVSASGINGYWIDAGWYYRQFCATEGGCQGGPGVGAWFDGYGNYSADPDRFHNGSMKAVGDAAHAAGLDFILWVEPERVMKGLCVGNLTCGYNEAIELLRAHPEWGRCVGGVNTQPTGKDLGSIQCLWYYGAAGALEWMQQRLSSMIEDWGVDIYRQDRNGASPYGYWKLGETAERVGASEALHIGGMYDLFDHLKVSKPSLLIDNCASGGRRLDLEMMRRSIPLHRTDWQPSPTFTPAQGHTYGLSQFIPVQGPSYGVDSMPCYPWTPAEICLPNKTAALSMFSPTQSVGISQDPQGGWHDWGNETDAWWADFLRINELLQPLRPLLKGDFYPLTEWSGIDENGWLAWQHVRSDLTPDATAAAIVTVFRRFFEVEVSIVLPLHGLEPQTIYSVTSWDATDGPPPKTPAQQRTGLSLMEEGLEVVIGSAPGSELLVLTEVSA